MGVSWPAVEAALTTDPHRLPPALLADVQRHLEGLVFGPASQQPLNLSWSPPNFECETPRPAGQPPRRIIDVVPFSYELDVPPEHAELLSRTLVLRPLSRTLSGTTLSLDLAWQPLRPLRSTVALVVQVRLRLRASPKHPNS